MKDCYYYFSIEPMQTSYKDNAGISPLVEIPVKTKRGMGSIALLGKPNEVHLLRVMIPLLQEEKLTDKDCSLIQDLKEHALSILRLCYDADSQLTPFTFWHFTDSGTGPSLDLRAEELLNSQWRLDSENFKNSYLNGYDNRHQLHLLSEALNQRVPIQFRFLSVYKFLEHEYKDGGSWKPDLEVLLDRFQASFDQLQLSTLPLKKYIHALRDRCAHIRGRGKLVGVTALSNKDALELQKALPLLMEICSSAFNDLHGSKGLQLGRTPPSAAKASTT
jgi:hypothetical protein